MSDNPGVLIAFVSILTGYFLANAMYHLDRLCRLLARRERLEKEAAAWAGWEGDKNK